MTPDARRRAIVWASAIAGLAAATLGMLVLRGHLEETHVALVYLLVVLAGSAAGGRALGLVLSGLAFFAFDYLFLPPYGTLVIANPLDWLALVTFLITAIVAAQLLTSAQERAAEARRRTVEVQRLAELGAETLNAGRPEDALIAIADVIRGTLGVDRCDIFARADGGALRIIASAPDRPRSR